MSFFTVTWAPLYKVPKALVPGDDSWRDELTLDLRLQRSSGDQEETSFSFEPEFPLVLAYSSRSTSVTRVVIDIHSDKQE